MKYRKKSVIIEAVRWTGNNIREVADFTNKEVLTSMKLDTLKIKSPEGDVNAKVGDYIIKGVTGEFYPCKPGIFEQTYEPIIE